MSLLVVSSLLLLASVSANGETLVEHEYGVNHNQIDDGAEYAPHVEVARDDPSFAQGYFLKDAVTETNARCLDGTPALYYHRKGTGSGANKWFLHQQGGGWCYDLNSCVGRSHGSLGSTAKDKPTSSLNSGYTSLDPKTNPLMYNWNSVEIRYCDGASVSGDKETPTNVSGTMLHFRGRAILDAEIKSLLQDRGMDKASDVVVSGCSAGGLATFLHCDHWAAAIANATNGAAKVACMPDSGFFLDEQRKPGYHANMKNVYTFQESSAAGLNAACVEAHKATGDTYKCIFAQWSSAHIKTPTFPLQSQYDSWQTGNVMGGGDAPTQNAFGANLTALVKSQLLNQPQHGIFLDSCHHHCGNWDGSEIDGMLSGAALQAWYTKGSPALDNKGFFNQNKPFPCDACCKPDPAPTTVCKKTEYCCPDAKHCLAPTDVSCAKDSTICQAGQACCPLTKLCVDVGAPCKSPCADQGTYCCPDALHCLTPNPPGVFCKAASDCAKGDVCCPLTNICVSVGATCTPP